MEVDFSIVIVALTEEKPVRKMGRRQEVIGTIGDRNILNIYIPPQDREDLKKIAKAQGFKSVSALIRHNVAPLLAEFREGKIKMPQFDIKRKEEELTGLLKDKNKLAKALQDQYSPDSSLSDFEKMCRYVVSLGADSELQTGLEDALEKLRKPSLNEACPCTGATRIQFCKLLSLVIECRAIRTEIDHYYEHEGKGS